MVPWASAKEWVGREVFEAVPLQQQARLLGLLTGEVCLGGIVYPLCLWWECVGCFLPCLSYS